MTGTRERWRWLTYCFSFFFSAEFLLFTLIIMAGKSRPNSGEHFLFYWLVGPLGAFLQRYFILSDFPYLTFVVAFFVNPLLYGLLIYPLVSLSNHLNHNK